MKNLITFEEFLLEKSLYKEKVAIFPGRYMPFHLGHLAALEKTSKVFGCKVIPIQIISKSEKSPFPESLLAKIGESVAKESNFIAEYIIYPQNLKTVIPQMVKLLQEKGYDVIGIGCGSDRLKDYQRQVDYLTSSKSDVKVDEFNIEMVDVRSSEGPSGTKVREAIIADDKKRFEALTPKSVHPFYYQLQKAIKDA